MNIKEIKQYSRDTINEILKLSASIHPKLISVLQFRDIFDDTLMDDSLRDRYNTQILPLVKEYQNNLRTMKEEYLTQYFEDFMECSDFEDYGINLRTGLWVDQPKAWLEEDVEFLPRVEVQAMYDGVRNIHSNRATFTPFWERYGYTMISDHEKASVNAASSPSAFIRGCRSMFRQTHRNGVYKVLDSAKLANTFDYEIHLEPLTQYDERNIVNNYIVNGVQRHAKLRDFLESSIDKSLPYYYSTFDGTKHTFRGP